MRKDAGEELREVSKEEIRLDKYLQEKFHHISRSRIQSLIKSGNVKVNDETELRKSAMVSHEDYVEVKTEEHARETALEAEKMNLNIVYEDEHILVVNKSQGVLVHPTDRHEKGTLAAGLKMYLGDNIASGSGPLRPGIVHRIDRDTSGLLVVAKTDEAYEALRKTFDNHNIYREYWALVYGTPKLERGVIDKPLKRSRTNPNKRVVDVGGKPAVTGYKLISAYDKVSVVKLELSTGRTHQIRVHMAYMGNPVVGDPLYGSGNKLYKADGQFLHCRKLGFSHPVTKMYMNFSAPLPDKFIREIKKLNGK